MGKKIWVQGRGIARERERKEKGRRKGGKMGFKVFLSADTVAISMWTV